MNPAFASNSADTLPLAGTTPWGRPSWSGLLQFSLVGIPLKAYPAVRTRDVPSAHLLHAACGQRLGYAKHCPVHGPVDSAAIVKGYEYGPEQDLTSVQQPPAPPSMPVDDRAPINGLPVSCTPCSTTDFARGGATLRADVHVEL
jgi:hypothetical protein